MLVAFFVASVSATAIGEASSRVLAFALGGWKLVPFPVSSVSVSFFDQLFPRFIARFRERFGFGLILGSSHWSGRRFSSSFYTGAVL